REYSLDRVDILRPPRFAGRIQTRKKLICTPVRNLFLVDSKHHNVRLDDITHFLAVAVHEVVTSPLIILAKLKETGRSENAAWLLKIPICFVKRLSAERPCCSVIHRPPNFCPQPLVSFFCHDQIQNAADGNDSVRLSFAGPQVCSRISAGLS